MISWFYSQILDDVARTALSYRGEVGWEGVGLRMDMCAHHHAWWHRRTCLDESERVHLGVSRNLLRGSRAAAAAVSYPFAAHCYLCGPWAI